MKPFPIGLQLYTVRALAERDFAGTLKAVANLGYHHVELAGLFGHSSSDVKAMLDDASLGVTSAHVSLEELEANPDKAFTDAITLSHRAIVIPWLDPALRQSAADWRKLGRRLAQLGASARAANIALLYHNHDFEFARFDGIVAMELLLDTTPPDSVALELDVFWAAFAGVDPLDFMHRFRARIAALHLKDLAAGPEKRFAPVGTGLLDFPAILQAATRIPIKFAAVEQDETYELPPLDAAAIIAKNLKKLGVLP